MTIAAVGIGALVATGNPATADPKQFNAATGVGSDTTQDVMNALAGFTNTSSYTPAQSSAASGRRQLTSWDATGSACITPKAPGATFTRPNGSTGGRRALSRSIDGSGYDAANCGGGLKVISGLVQYARSSAGPSGSGTALTYIPFGRDALSFGYYANGVAPVTTLTSAQLTSLFRNGPATIDGVEIVPCGIQLGSGTYQFWNTATGNTADQEATGTQVCNSAALDAGLNPNLSGRSQENDASALKARGDLPAFAGKQVIIGFSAANFISQSNGVVASQLPAGGVVKLGAIDALGLPHTGTAPSLSPSSGFYASTTYGRDVYNVLSKGLLDNPGNNDIKTLFVGSTSGVCTSTSTIQTFGFLSLGADCGSTTLTGPLVTGTL
ncbi:MAG: hypothetical protein Q8K58_00405 [Acidimicrobiales bacterium]|nr:hypothetical protein [Acidimicrobiales bacterium]